MTRVAAGRALAALPTLPDVVTDPSLVERLPRLVAIEYQRLLRRLDADLGAHIAASADGASATGGPAPPEERALGLEEAA